MGLQYPCRSARIHNFSSATDEIPPPPEFVESKRRTRVNVSPTLLELFEHAAGGIFLSAKDKEALVSTLPLVASHLATPPEIDERLAKTQGSKPFPQDAILASLQETILNALNALTFGLEAFGKEENDLARSYFDIGVRLLGVSLQVRYLTISIYST